MSRSFPHCLQLNSGIESKIFREPLSYSSFPCHHPMLHCLRKLQRRLFSSHRWQPRDTGLLAEKMINPGSIPETLRNFFLLQIAPTACGSQLAF